jgi:hypothetical protein
VIGAVLVGRIIRAFPYLLPNRLPGLVIHELGPSLALALAIGSAVNITRESNAGLTAPARLALFALAAVVAGAAVLAWEFGDSLRGTWV